MTRLCVVTRLRLCFPPTLSSRKLRRDSCCHNLNGYAPRFYARAWACLWLFVGLLLLTYWGFRWLPLPFLGWLVGHGVLVLLTQWNPKWDDMLVAHMNQRYKSRYSAG